MRPRMSQDEAFWRIVEKLNWKLDDGRSGPPPAAEPEFNHGGRPARELPVWTTHLVAFLVGGLCLGILLVAPALVVAIVLWTVGCMGVVRALRRRR